MIKVATSKFVTSTGSSGEFMIALEVAVLTINRVLHPIIPWLLAAKKKLKVPLEDILSLVICTMDLNQGNLQCKTPRRAVDHFEDIKAVNLKPCCFIIDTITVSPVCWR